MVALPRLVIAAPASGHGKTTVATGLMAALARTGLAVSGHKVGPDYIDPGYHALATGRPGRNLDPHLVGEDRLVPLLLHGARGADVAIVEGVMGLYDGQLGGHGFASTAHVATVTRSPVVLVVDVSHASRSIGAVVRGMVGFDPSVEIVGVILNKVGTDRHAAEVVGSIDLPVLGVLHRDDGIVAPSRHLGLVPAQERDEAAHALDRLTDRLAERVDLERVLELARSAPDLEGEAWDPRREVVISTSSIPRQARTNARQARPPVVGPWSRSPAAARSRSATPRPRNCSLPPAATWSPSTRSPTAPCRRRRRASTWAAASPRCMPPGCPPTPDSARTCTRRSRPASPPSPSAPACSTSATPSTAPRWWALWTHGRRCPRG